MWNVLLSLLLPILFFLQYYVVVTKKKDYISHIPYASAKGSLMYTMVCTRLDILHEVGAYNRYEANLGNGL